MFAGFLGMRQWFSGEAYKRYHIEDAVTVVAQAFKQLSNEKNISNAPTNCNFDRRSSWMRDDGEIVLELVHNLFVP